MKILTEYGDYSEKLLKVSFIFMNKSVLLLGTSVDVQNLRSWKYVYFFLIYHCVMFGKSSVVSIIF